MKSFSLLVCACLLFNLSCKKKDKQTEDNLPETTVGAATKGFNGIFTTGSYTTVITGKTFAGSGASAYFSNQAVLAIDPLKSARVARVVLNNDSLIYSSSTKYYSPTAAAINLATETWSVNGSNDIPSFTYQNTLGFPSVEAGLTLPDTISKTRGCTINLRVDFITSANLLLVDGNSTAANFFSVILAKGDNAIKISEGDMEKMVTSSNAHIAVVLENSVSTVFSAKPFKFIRECQFTKQVTIAP